MINYEYRIHAVLTEAFLSRKKTGSRRIEFQELSQ
jgi:hypothetical protein